MREFKILITGADGFIGSALYRRLAIEAKVIALDFNRKSENLPDSLIWEQADISDLATVEDVFHRHMPDVVIHCAGIAHQKVGAVSAEDYMRINSKATENLAKVAATSNPNVRFIFLSTVSVYGEKNLSMPVSEDSTYNPSSDYAVSKCDAEKRLLELSEGGILNNLIILRLAPVYDRDWGLNLERRVFAPKKMAYLRFGQGEQRITALARPNLIDFVSHLINQYKEISKDGSHVYIFNICDAQVYSFQKIIQVFRKSGIYPDRMIIPIPLFPVWLLTRSIGMLFKDNRDWWHACYDKVASDLVFDNNHMLSTGFSPRHSLKTVFLNAPEA